ncbi:hypothetical protein CN198_13805 [Sinorhizobium meliloti]|uniref:hypothetical protein n=1 Tax=Rhizobium meliloti TaxID=382 RepID=UPI000FDA370C|nr:hypothetical protein [Sinorhizobium meliloti]RVH69138.1 hypothetical protein CN198_13805 [Sinorhizobium meliloti]
MPNIKPLDEAEFAVNTVESRLASMIGELRGLMKAADIARCEAFDRAAAVHVIDAETQGEKFLRIGEEFQLHNAAFRKLETVAQAANAALGGIEAARERFRANREQGELEKLLALFETEDTKTK